jgi:hypothetical protein
MVPAMPDALSAPDPQPGARMRVIGETPSMCRSEVTPAVDPTTPGAGLMWREGGQAVGLYRLLDRRVNGCPAPIVVNYRVPGSNALGREAGRAQPTQPATILP